MKLGFNRFFTCLGDGEVFSYIFVDTSKLEPTRNGPAYRETVEFNVKSRGGLASNYPVIYEDFSEMHGRLLVEIPFAAVPPPIKGRYTRWERVQ